MPNHFLQSMLQGRQGAQGGVFGKADQFLQKPGGMMLLNLLAQEGFSTTPQSPLGAIGRAGLATQQQQQGQQQADLQRRLIEAQIGLTNTRASAQAGPQRRVQSAQKLANGNIGYIDAFSGKVIDTGVKFSKKVELIRQADGSVVAVDTETGTSIGETISPQQASAATTRAAESEDVAKRTVSAPKDIRAAESSLSNVTQIRKDVNDLLGDVGITTTGPLGAVLQFVPGFEARDFATVKRRITSFLALEKINEMKQQSATGATGLGAVNAKEFEALATAKANLDQASSPSAITKELRTLLAVLSRIEQTAQEDIERARAITDDSDLPPGFSEAE